MTCIGRARGRGRGRFVPAENEVSIENAHVHGNPPTHNKEVEEDI